ncbi:MAG: hypothetical protein R3E87_08600 [Burkholderiaceae bacterium]
MKSPRSLLLLFVGMVLVALMAWRERPSSSVGQPAVAGNAVSGLSEQERQRLREQLRDHWSGLRRVSQPAEGLAELHRSVD